MLLLPYTVLLLLCTLLPLPCTVLLLLCTLLPLPCTVLLLPCTLLLLLPCTMLLRLSVLLSVSTCWCIPYFRGTAECAALLHLATVRLSCLTVLLWLWLLP